MPDINASFVLISPRSKLAVHSSGISANVRVGVEYQAEDIPKMLSDPEKVRDNELSAVDELLVWEPTDVISESEITDFVVEACKEFNYNQDQAHGLLYWHKMDVTTAKEDLKKFAPYPDLWNESEKQTFEQGLVIHGKNFNEINKMLPNKTSKEIVSHYFHRTINKENEDFLQTKKKLRLKSPSPNRRHGVLRNIS